MSLTLAGSTAESELKQSNITTVTARLKDSSAMTAQLITNNIAKFPSENIEDDLSGEDDLLADAMEGNASSGLKNERRHWMIVVEGKRVMIAKHMTKSTGTRTFPEITLMRLLNDINANE